MSGPLFGPSGNSDSFYEQGYKSSFQMPAWLRDMGLTAYEYAAGKGLHLSDETAVLIGEKAREAGIAMSLHAPYSISLTVEEPERRDGAVEHILKAVRKASLMGATRVVVHSGSASRRPREEALALAGDMLRRALSEMDAAGLSHIHLCPETMGKVNQLGTLDEVISLCRLDDRLLPTVDFGHLNARTQGGLSTREAVAEVFDTVERGLGADRMRHMHVHFSKIEYSEGGEKRHLTFADTLYGPDFEPVAELCHEKDCRAVFICESRGTMAEDALTMKRLFEAASGRT